MPAASSQRQPAAAPTSKQASAKINLNLWDSGSSSGSQKHSLSSAQQQQQQKQMLQASNPMIVNSQPYNPSHQQRCISLNQQQQHQEASHRSMVAGASQQSQQNSLYGSSAFTTTAAPTTTTAATSANMQSSSHMFDLANLQQSVFDSAYDIAANVVAEPASSASSRVGPTRAARPQDNSSSHNQQQQQNEASLYSPSSSTSLLYHIYDQINLPSEQQQQYQQQQQQAASLLVGKKASTILNPANLFGSSTSQQQALPLQLHQHQMSELQRQQQQQQQCYGSSNGNQQHLEQPFGTLHQHQASYMSALQQSNLMLDTILRQQHQQAVMAAALAGANTLGRSHHQRPLSSSGASSMSGQSMAPIAYGRQPRSASRSSAAANAINLATSLGHHHPLNVGPSKSQANLASVLQAASSLNHLGVGSHSPGIIAGSAKGPVRGGNPFQGGCKRLQQRARHFAYEYRTMIKFSLLFILLALSLTSIVKFTLLSAQQQQQTSAMSPASRHQFASQQASNSQQLGSNTLPYPPFLQKLEPNYAGAQPTEETGGDNVDASPTRQPQQQDVLKSKLLIGEFVILSQNYSQSQSQRSLLAERIVKLMDQVFLATDVRRVYSRMEVTNIRPNRPNGIVVDCNIILSDSIAYAAQQFGIALYDSLARSHERLANQANYIIDKNSIRFNTVPDKDIKSGIVPPGLISPALSRELAVSAGGQDQVAPSFGQSLGDQSIEQQVSSMPTLINSQLDVGSNLPPLLDNSERQRQRQEDLENLVVWSEWSEWSSCVDKNGVCDPTRHHSRIRKCLAQLTGKEVNATLCKERFNMEDQKLEMAFCTRTCQQQQQQQQQAASPSASGPAGSDSHIMSDAPSVVGPQTAPSVLIGGAEQSGSGGASPHFGLLAPSLLLAPASSTMSSPQQQGKAPKMAAVAVSAASSGKELLLSAAASGASSSAGAGGDLYSSPASAGAAGLLGVSTLPSALLGASSAGPASAERGQELAPAPLAALGGPSGDSQLSCSNCTSDEICLLLMQEKVPFCAKIKERSDESGCGGWCRAQSQLCQPVGQNAFKCIHDSECLAEEWRCHDSACIPLSKRCDGHSNCYDSSDERDCPIQR